MTRRFATVSFTLFSLLIAVGAYAQSADLFVTKTAPASANVGDNITITIDTGNGGPDAATNFNLTDTLPSGGTFVSESNPPSLTCTTPLGGAPGGTVNCTAATFNAGATAEILVVINASAGSAGTTLIDTVQVSSSTADNNPENNTSASGTSIPGGNLADVGVSKTGPASAIPGSSVTFTITVTNFGPNDATTVNLNDTLGAGFSGMTVTQTSGPTFSCPGNTTPCSISKLTNGSSATFTLVTTISSTPGTYTNTATVTSDNDPTSENNSSTASVTASSADIGVNKSGPATANAGSEFTYTVVLSNSGPDAAPSATFTDTLPAGLTFVNIGLPGGGSCSTPPPGSGGTVSCTSGELLNGSSATFTIMVMADASTPNGTFVTNTATASSPVPDPNGNNNTSNANTTITANADVSVMKSGPASAIAGTAVTYTITVANGGPSNATSVTMSDTLPAGTTFTSLNQTSGPAFTCTTGATVTCSLATFLAGGSATFQLVANVSSTVANGTTITNTATVVSTTPDSTPGNNSSPAATSITTSADLSVMKSGPTGALAGTPITYTITANNGGPSDAQSVTLTDTLPPGATFISMNQTTGPTFTCGPPSGGVVTCTIAVFGAGQSASFSLALSMPVATPTGTMITNSVTIASPTFDSKTSNNTATATTTISGAPDLAVKKTAPATVAAGATFTYSVTLANTGAGNAPNVTLTDALPASVTFNSLTQTSPLLTCSTPAAGTNGTISCTATSFASGATDTLTISVTASPTLATGTTINNTATATTTATDLNTANNTSTATTTVNPGDADLAIAKSAPTNTVITASSVTFTINVTNNGPSSADNVVVTDTLPSGVTFKSATPSQGTCSGTTTVVCSLGTLANGASATITIQVQAGVPGNNTANTATVTSANPDSNPANNTATTAAFTITNFNNIPAASPLGLMLLAILLAVGGALILRRG